MQLFRAEISYLEIEEEEKKKAHSSSSDYIVHLDMP